MKSDSTCEQIRYLVVTPRLYSLTEDNLHAVEDSWGYDLEAHAAVFPNLHIFAPFDPKYKSRAYSYVFSKESTITFHPLFSCASEPLDIMASKREVLIRIPQIVAILVRNIKKQDIVQSAGPFINLIAPLTHILCAIMKHQRRILILDADAVKDMELSIELEQTQLKKLFLTVAKSLISLTQLLIVRLSPLTFVVGDALYSKFSRMGNVKKIYASWISKRDVLSSANVRDKAITVQRRRCYKLIYAARLIHTKGPDIAVKVAAILHEKGIPTKLDIYGAGPLRDHILDLVSDNNLSDIATLKGNIKYNDFLRVLTQYDILLLPNLSGEQPRAPFDAMAKGVLVLASNIISLRPIITNNYNGILCEPGNPESFARAIEQLYLNKIDLTSILCNSTLKATQNTIESMHETRKSIVEATFAAREHGVEPTS